MGGGFDGRPMMNVPGLNHEATARAHNWQTQRGQQYVASWEAGKTDEKPLLTAEPAPSLWRVSVFGDVLLRVEWGTSSTFMVGDVRGPLVASFPGRVSISARPRDGATPTRALASLTASDSGIESIFRKFVDTPGQFDPYAVAVVALNAVVVTVAGINVNLVAGQRLRIIDDAALVSGSVIVELAA